LAREACQERVLGAVWRAQDERVVASEDDRASVGSDRGVTARPEVASCAGLFVDQHDVWRGLVRFDDDGGAGGGNDR
jgi:hypothetical protein